MMMRKTAVLLLTAGCLTACGTPVSSLSEQDLTRVASEGNGTAQYQLARRLAAKPDYPAAMRWMQKAAEQGGRLSASSDVRGAAALQVADWYQEGLGEPKNIPLAERWWHKSAYFGNSEANYRLGMQCKFRHQNTLAPECMDAFEAAAGKRHAGAQLAMAEWYAAHADSAKEAIRWFERSAEQGNRDAQYQLALRYEKGQGVTQRSDMAERGYYKAALAGQPQAQYWMAQHTQGSESLEWYRKASQGGEPQAQLWLGMAYLTGSKLPLDKPQGETLLKKAAAGGSAEANYQLGLLSQTADQKVAYLQTASAKGFLKAQYELGLYYQQTGDLVHARIEFGKAAAQSDVLAQLAYGEMLRLGLGGKEDYAEAVKQYRRASSANNRMAQYRMGTMRQEGLGVPRNRIHAYAWFSLAATEGMVNAINARNALEEGMQPDEVKAAQKLAMHWSSGKGMASERDSQ
ncbi:tetratricopeptide repeat protein [Lonsdalea quercina]|uniref:tetratricopeptide repeat protein n=1 Tax=Lonsdalea quercina TaxID=71657 RepID=UPI003975A9D5